MRDELVAAALRWEAAFCNAPAITSALSEYDAALLLGMQPKDYAEAMKGSTVVQRGFDFRFQEFRYQVKANRPSGKPGSTVTLVAKAANYDWDRLIWILYDRAYAVKEAWLWEVDSYKLEFHLLKRLSPAHYRRGHRLA